MQGGVFETGQAMQASQRQGGEGHACAQVSAVEVGVDFLPQNVLADDLTADARGILRQFEVEPVARLYLVRHCEMLPSLQRELVLVLVPGSPATTPAINFTALQAPITCPSKRRL